MLRNNTDMRYSHYKDLDDRTLLNLSFRNGDALHCLWTSDEENMILPYLVSIGKKPIAGIVIGKSNHHNIIIPSNCKSYVMKNRWGVHMIYIYRKDSPFTVCDIRDLANEENDWTVRGDMYGYNINKE